MRPGLLTGLAGAAVLASATLPADAAVEREDLLILDADGRHYTSYKTLRSDLAERVLYLGPDEAPGDNLYIVPSNYRRSDDPDGGTQLRFDTGSYAVMGTGRFSDDELRRGDDGVYVFTSWDGRRRADGHHGKWNEPNDFDSFAYTWVVPASVEIVDYSANRSGDWSHQGRNLTWRGEDVNDITFRIRYRVDAAQSAGTASAPPVHASESGTKPTGETEPFQPVPKRQRMAIGSRSDTRVADVSRPSADPGRPAPQAVPAEHPSASPLETTPIEIPNLQTEPAAALAPMPSDDTTAGPSAPQPPSEAGRKRSGAATDDGGGAASEAPDGIALESVVVLAGARPTITARGQVVLDRLARRLAERAARQVTVTGPAIENTRDMGGSAAQAARVADYLANHGLVSDTVDSRAGTTRSAHGASTVRVTTEPDAALAGFDPGR